MVTYQFNFVFTLSALHFLSQAIALEFVGIIGVFERKRLPFLQNVLTGLAGVASIVFMNFNLRFNSVGIYQISKLCCIPLMVWVQTKFYGKSFSDQIKFTLFVILLGVGITAVTDISANALGLLFAAVAVVSTTQFQIWQGSKQRDFSVSSIQITHSVSLPMFFITACAAWYFETSGATSVLLHKYAGKEEYFAIVLSCILAIAVNISSFTLIGISSPVTYQVVGHLKTVLVLIGGIMMFPMNQTTSQLLKNILGIAVAMIGVVLYGEIKQAETNNTSTLIDRYMPRALYKRLFKTKESYLPMNTAA